MRNETRKRLTEAVLAVCEDSPELHPDIVTGTYAEDGMQYCTAEIRLSAVNAPLFGALSRLCRKIEKETGIHAPEDSACPWLWLEVCRQTETLNSSTRLKSGQWYESSEFGDIHESFTDEFAEEVIAALSVRAVAP